MRITFTVQFDQPENDQVLRATISGQSHGFGVGLHVLTFQEWRTLIERFLEAGEIHLRGGASVSTFTDPDRNPPVEGADVLISLPGHESNAIPQLAWWTLLFSVGAWYFKSSSALDEAEDAGDGRRWRILHEAVIAQLQTWQFQGEYRVNPIIKNEDVALLEAAVETTSDWCPTYPTEMQHTLIWESATGIANGSHFSGREMIGSIPVPTNNRSEFAELLQCLGLWGKKIPTTLFDLATNSHLPAADFIQSYHQLVDALDRLAADGVHAGAWGQVPFGADWYWQLAQWGIEATDAQLDFSIAVMQQVRPGDVVAGAQLDIVWEGNEVPLCVAEIMPGRCGIVVDLYRI